MAAGVPVRSADGRHVIGRVEDGTFIKPVKGSVHKLRTPVAWACDVAALRQAEALGARQVVIIDTETAQRFTAALSLFWEKGVKLSRGYGPQLALPLADWRVERPGEALQLGLW